MLGAVSMTGTSSEWSEEAPGADILDLDRYMRGTRPARRPQRNISNTGLVVDGGALVHSLSLPSSSGSWSEVSDKRFSHDSGLSDTSYRDSQEQGHRRKKEEKHTKNDVETRRRVNNSESEESPQRSKSAGKARRGKTDSEARRDKTGSEARRGKTGGEARRGKTINEARRGKSGSSTRRSSESRSSFRELLERALRDQQAQIARVAQMFELQAAQARFRSGATERRSDRPSDRSERRKERRGRSEREPRSEKRNERATERPNGPESRTTSFSSEFSSSSSSVDPDPVKRRTSECRTYKIIMSKLDELNRLFIARRNTGAPVALPGALAAKGRAPYVAPAGPHDDSSVTVSDKVVGTENQTARQKQLESERNRTIIVATTAVDIPPTQRTNVVTESIMHKREISAPASEKGMPGGFHLDDPVRLYQQAKRLDARERNSGSSSGSHDSDRDSGSGSKYLGSSKGSRSPSLCALCRCYWTLARRYVAQLNPVKE